MAFDLCRIVLATIAVALAPRLVNSACNPGWEYAPGADMNTCYKFVGNGERVNGYNDPDQDFVPFHVALEECALQGGQVWRPLDMGNVQAVENYLFANYGYLFIKADGRIKSNGTWTAYMRQNIAVTADYETVIRPERQDPLKYFDAYNVCPDKLMPLSLWRGITLEDEEPQPDDKPDNPGGLIDESCVALKKIGDPQYFGLDDWNCLSERHTILCQQCGDFAPAGTEGPTGPDEP